MQPLYEYVCHLKGHRNSKGELAEWVIKSHETGEILSSHKSEKKAKEHLQQMHIFNEAAARSIQDKKSDKLIGESTYGTDMDKRVKIFMEGVGQLGLTSSQVEAIGKLTNACMESALELPEDFTDEDLANRDDLEERQLDQVYDELWKLGVSTDTINARGRENDFSFNTMYQLLKDVCADKGIPVPEIDGAEDDSTNLSDLWGDPEEPEELASLTSNEPEELDF